MKVKPHFNALWLGKPGTLKSITAAEFHKEGKTFIFDFDNRMNSLKAWYGGELPVNIEHITLRETLYDMQQGNYWSVEKLYQIFNEWYAKYATLDPKSNEITWEGFPYRTVILDSLTSFDEGMKLKAMKDQRHAKAIKGRAAPGVPHLSDYGIHSAYLAGFFPSFLLLPCNVIITAHLLQSADETGMLKMEQVMMSGKKFPDKVCSYFDNIWGFSSLVGYDQDNPDNVKFRIRLHPTRTFDFKCMFYPSPPEIDANYEAIQAILPWNEKEKNDATQ